MIIDIHGHYTTAPKALEAWRNRQIAGIKNPSKMPAASELHIGDDELCESIEGNQLRLMPERGLDLAVFSPRASFMASANEQASTAMKPKIRQARITCGYPPFRFWTHSPISIFPV